jgi:hypothetical protein
MLETICHRIFAACGGVEPSPNAVAVPCRQRGIQGAEIRKPLAVFLDDRGNDIFFGRKIAVQLLNGDSGFPCDQRNASRMKSVLHEQPTRDFLDILSAQFGT